MELSVPYQSPRLFTAAYCGGKWQVTWADEYDQVDCAEYIETDSGVEFVDSDSLRRLPAELVDVLNEIVHEPRRCWGRQARKVAVQ